MERIHKKDIGTIGEAVAGRYLCAKGYSIRARNVRFPLGEIDIVAQKANVIHFFEVKTILLKGVSPACAGRREIQNPMERISREKLRKMKNAVLCYLKNVAEKDPEIQLDGIAVVLDEKRRKAKVNITENIDT